MVLTRLDVAIANNNPSHYTVLYRGIWGSSVLCQLWVHLYEQTDELQKIAVKVLMKTIIFMVAQTLRGIIEAGPLLDIQTGPIINLEFPTMWC